MQIVSDLAMITNGTVSIQGKNVPVFDIEVIPADDQDPDKLKFDWSVVGMTEQENTHCFWFRDFTQEYKSEL